MTLKALKELRESVEVGLYDDELLLKLIDEQIRMKENSSYVKLAKCPKCGRKPNRGYEVGLRRSFSGNVIHCCGIRTVRYKRERDARIAWNRIVEEKNNEIERSYSRN